jgi:hypothetical protein
MPQEDDRNSFVRGMTIGAIIGAIVAGSSLWSRRRRARRAPELEPGPEAVHSDGEPRATSVSASEPPEPDAGSTADRD